MCWTGHGPPRQRAAVYASYADTAAADTVLIPPFERLFREYHCLIHNYGDPAMNRYLTLLLALPILLAGCNGVDGVNQSIQVDAFSDSGNHATVNGSITVGEGGQAGKLSTVNGSIVLGKDSSAIGATTVNGSVRLDTDARVVGDATTVNGKISLAKGARIDGNATNVNGDIRLEEAVVEGNIRSVQADITIGANSRVGGGIYIKKSTNLFSKDDQKPMRMVIGPNAVVEGPLEFGREVVLHVSESARIGAVSGAKAIRFKGETPETSD